ncbi:hypothetical protein ABZT03_34080 [Streptomyces sp. NPDC005574]|uniref:hypothetical protein n=1 Tax=Streptomyces sp. NPDC005574 TaxID=3156891 RepID=UPI0033BF478A
MPRRRPGRVRANTPGRRTRDARTVIDGLSARALSEISHLERTRTCLHPGDAGMALRRWKTYVHRPERRLWHDYEWDDAYGECCGTPLEARALLDTVTRALSPRSARELRQLISRYDAVWNRPSPPYLPD